MAAAWAMTFGEPGPALAEPVVAQRCVRRMFPRSDQAVLRVCRCSTDKRLGASSSAAVPDDVIASDAAQQWSTQYAQAFRGATRAQAEARR